MVNVQVCDFCIQEDKIAIASYKIKSTMNGNPIRMCKVHSKQAAKVANGDKMEVLDLLAKAESKIQELQVKGR